MADPPAVEVQTLEHWADAIERLSMDLGEATATPELWQPPAGTYALDLLALGAEAPEWVDKGIIERVAFDSAKFVSLILRHGRAVGSLVRSGEIFVSMWPIIRAQLEACGRLGWILEPHDDQIGLGPRRRAARYFMEMLGSVCYQREALKALKSPHAAKAKTLRKHTVSEIERLFGTTLKWEGPGSEDRWTIANDRYESLAAGAKRFANHMIPDLPAIYPTMSGYAHPSLRFLTELLHEEAGPEGLRTMTWRSDRRLLHFQCRVSTVLMYRSTTLMFSYLGGPQERLERAMDRCEEAIGIAP
jgi:hypothetical protein